MRDALVICTRDRPEDVRHCLASVAAQIEPPSCVLVADSSAGPETEQITQLFPLAVHRNVQPGLTRQRNAAMDVLDPEIEVVHFVDDDTILDAGYTREIKRAFADPTVVGVGGVITNLSPQNPRLAYRLFLLDSRRPGVVLRSGRNILSTDLNDPARVDWLSGCGMSFRAWVLRKHRFEEALTGNSFGEDVEYCLRVAPEGALIATPFARLEHRPSPVNRYPASRWYTAEVVARHWRVRRFPQRLSRTAFWWSVAGELTLALAKSLVRLKRSPLVQARAIAIASWSILTDDRRVVDG